MAKPDLTTYSLDTDHLTVIATDEHGERHDLNAAGEPCRTRTDLEQLLSALLAERCIGRHTYDALCGEL